MSRSRDSGAELRMRPAPAAVLAAVATAAFAALLLLLAYGSSLRQDRGGAHALSVSAVGFSGLATALRLSGEPVTVNRGRLPPGRSAGLLVVTPPIGTDLQAVEQLGFQGPILVILPKWLTTPDPAHADWVRRAGLLPPASLEQAPLVGHVQTSSAAAADATTLEGQAAPFAGQRLQAGPIQSLRRFENKGWTTVLAGPSGEPVLARSPARQPIYVLAEPDLMNNHGLVDERTFATALAIVHALQAGEGPVIFDVRLNGLGVGRSPLRLLFDPPFLAMTLCLAAAAMLAAWQALAQFGPVVRPPGAIALGKTTLVENTAALVRLARREADLALPYAGLTAALAAQAVAAPRALNRSEQVAFLDRLGVQRGAEASLAELTQRAAATRTPAEAVTLAQRLWLWRRAVCGDRS